MPRGKAKRDRHVTPRGPNGRVGALGRSYNAKQDPAYKAKKRKTKRKAHQLTEAEEEVLWQQLKKQDEERGKQPFAYIENPKQRAVLRCYSILGVLRTALEAAKVWYSTHRTWLDTDERYSEAFQTAKEMAGDFLEEVAWRRAVEGLRKYKFTRTGEPLIHPETGEPYYETEFSDSLLKMLLQAHKPDRFKKENKVIQQIGVQLDRLREQVTDMDASICPPSRAVAMLMGESGSNGNGNGHAKVLDVESRSVSEEDED